MLAQGRRVIRVSLPGFGATPPTGHSRTHDLRSSAFVVVALAIAHGDRFGELIVANGGAAFSKDRQGAFTTMSDLVTESGMEAVVDVAVRRIFTEDYLATHPTAITERREVLVKTNPLAFASACHGAGRNMSRRAATKIWRGKEMVDQLKSQGIIIRSRSMRGIAEESPGAYKDVDAVVNATDKAKLAKKVARLVPMICVKG
jgi:hypothetical protein